MDDVMLIFQARSIVPEVVLIVLRPKGQVQVLGAGARWPAPAAERGSAGTLAGRGVVEVAGRGDAGLREPGVIPWIPLMESTGRRRNCSRNAGRSSMKNAKPEELANILAVSQVLASLRYNERWLFDFFGGKEAMIESPVFERDFSTRQFSQKLPRSASRVAKESQDSPRKSPRQLQRGHSALIATSGRLPAT